MGTKRLFWFVTIGVGLGLCACMDASPPGRQGAQVGSEGSGDGEQQVKETDVVVEEGDIVSFTCVTKLSEHTDPCLEGGCCGFPRGAAGECWESARCGYGTLEEEDSEQITGAVCSCSWCERYRVSCTADYETGQVECICTDSSM